MKIITSVDGGSHVLQLVMRLLALLAQDSAESVKADILEVIYILFSRGRHGWFYEEQISVAIVAALYHCLDAILSPTSNGRPVLPIQVIPDLLTFVLDLFQLPPVAYEVILHAIPLLVLCIRSCPMEHLESTGPAIQFLAVLTRSHDIGLRCAVAWSFSVLGPATSGVVQPDSSIAGQDPFPLLTAPRISESALIEECAQDSLTLLRRLAKDGDFRKFGIGLAYVLTQGPPTYNDQDIPDISSPTTACIRSRLGTWRGLLQKTATTLQSDTSLLGMGDHLELEHLTLVGPPAAVASRAQEVLARDPTHVYAHILFCEHASDHEAALSTARRGLDLDGLTPYLKRRLLFRAAELSYEEAFGVLLHMNPYDREKTQTCQQIMRLGLDYAHNFLVEAPQDCRDSPRLIDLCFSMVLVLDGPELGEDLERLQVR